MGNRHPRFHRNDGCPVRVGKLLLGGLAVKDYHIDVFYSEEDGMYVANIPDLKYCSAFGESPVEAVQEIMIAKEAWLEVAAKRGKPIPPPRYRSLASQL